MADSTTSHQQLPSPASTPFFTPSYLLFGQLYTHSFGGLKDVVHYELIDRFLFLFI